MYISRSCPAKHAYFSSTSLANVKISRSSVITRKDFTEQILHRIYASSETPTIDQIHPHRLAVFFAVVAIGASLNPEPSADQQGGKYYVLACAALSLVPIIAEAMVPTIQAIFMINSFLHNNNRVSAEESWLLTGLVGRLAFRVCKVIIFWNRL